MATSIVHGTAAGGKGLEFRSAWGRRAVFRLTPLALACLCGTMLLVRGGLAVGGVALAAAACAVAVWMLRGTRYRLNGGTLTIVAVPGRRREVPVSAIETMRRRPYATTWGTDAPPLQEDFALGTDVVEIRLSDGARLFVSPRDERAFLAAIDRPAEGVPERPSA